jgi:hypothetical protein
MTQAEVHFSELHSVDSGSILGLDIDYAEIVMILHSTVRQMQGQYIKLRLESLPSRSFQIHYSLIILPLDPI